MRQSEQNQHHDLKTVLTALFAVTIIVVMFTVAIIIELVEEKDELVLVVIRRAVILKIHELL